MSRLRMTVFTLIALLLIIVALPIAILNSTWALQFATTKINQLDGINVQYEQGTLFDTLVFSNINVTVPGWHITAQQLQTGLKLQCIWEQSLCISSLQLDQAVLTQLNTAPQITEPKATTSPTLPIPVSVDNLAVNSITLVLLDGTNINTNIVIPNITLALSERVGILTDISPLTIDITPLTIQLPTLVKSQSVSAVTSGSTASANATGSSSSSSSSTSSSTSAATATSAHATINRAAEIIRDSHQHWQSSKVQYQAILQQWQDLMRSPESWLHSQTRIEFPIHAPQINLNIDNITIYDVANTINLKQATLQAQLHITPEHIDTDLTIEHQHFSIKGAFALASDWTHSFATDMQWQALQVDQPALQVTLDAGQLSLHGTIQAWQLQSASTLQYIRFDELQLQDINWNITAFGDADAIIIKPSHLIYPPHQIWLTAHIPSQPDTIDEPKFDITLTHQSAGDIQSKNQISITGDMFDPRLIGQINITDLHQSGLIFSSINSQLTADFNQLTATTNALWTMQDDLAKAPYTYQQTLQLQLSPQDLQLNITDTQLDLPQGIVSLNPYKVAIDIDRNAAQQIDVGLSALAINWVDAEQQSIADFTINPISLALQPNWLANDTDAKQLDIELTNVNLNRFLTSINPLLSKPITITTDGILNGNAKLTLQPPLQSTSLDDSHIAITSALTISPSTWQITPKLDAIVTQAQLNAEATFSVNDPASSFQMTSTGSLVGERLGDIQYELVMDDKLTLFTQVKSINVDLLAPFLPQFKRFTGAASANVALTQQHNTLSLNGIIIVPELDIEIETIDESAATPHADIVITQPVKQGFSNPYSAFAEAPLDLLVNVRVLLDPLQKDTVSIAGFDFATDLQGSVEFYLDQQQPSVIGSIALNNGQYQAYGQDLLIRNGQLIFNGPVSLPFVQLEAIRNPKNMNDEVIAGLKISGLANQLNAELFSEPMLENPNILSYILRGKNLDDQSAEDNSVLLTNAILGFGLGKSQDTISEFGNKIGVDNLQLSTQGQGDNSQLGITGQLNERLSVEYRVGVFNAIAEFGLRYQWRPNLYVEATSGASNALDIFYQLAWGERTAQDALNEQTHKEPQQ